MELYKDRTKSPGQRAEDLLGRMTLREKVGQLNQRLYGFRIYERRGDEIILSQELKDEVERYGGLGVLYGLFRADPWSGRDENTGLPGALAIRAYNQIQKYVIEHSRFGIPMLMSSECPHGHQALGGYLLPVNLAVGATFDPALFGEAASVCAGQLKEMGVNLALVSLLDILRDPRWGRSEECFGEDPFLASAFAKAAVESMQKEGVAVVAKHFCAQGEGTGGINASAARIGERELREIHLPMAKACCEAGVQGVMAAYNEIDGVYCHVNQKLLRGILRGEFGFDGVVMADGVALDRLKEMTGDDVISAAKALKAGVDISLWDEVYPRLEEAVEKGLVPESLLDEAVLRVLTLKFAQGLFDHPYLEERGDAGARSLAGYPQTLQLARESAVLLKNERVSGMPDSECGRVLPLGDWAKRIAVIGPNADDIYRQLGDYTPPVLAGEYSTVLDGMRALAADRRKAGKECEILTCAFDELTEKKRREALACMESADVVVLVLGGSSSRFEGAEFDSNGAAIAGGEFQMECGEGLDVSGLKLPGDQEAWAALARESGKPLVTVVIQGRPYAIKPVADVSDGLMLCFYPGPAGGRAVAELLFGEESPSGRLPVSVPVSVGQLPVYYNYKASYAAMGYCDGGKEPLYSFGQGFGYGALHYGKMEISQEGTKPEISVTIEVSNDGAMDDYAVGQLYIHDLQSSTVRRARELKAFQRKKVRAGGRELLGLKLGEDAFRVWNENMEFSLEPGEVELIFMDQGIVWDKQTIRIG